MPFTISHAVLAPPLARLSAHRLPMSALAVGCMTPDAAHFLFLMPGPNAGHSWAGLILLDLPLGLLVLLAWHRVLKHPLTQLLPRRWSHLGCALDRPFAFLPAS